MSRAPRLRDICIPKPYLARSIETELISCCRHFDLDIVTYNLLAGGLFSGKIRSKDLVPTEGPYPDADAAERKLYHERYFEDVNFEALKIVKSVKQKHGWTLLISRGGGPVGIAH